MLIELGHSHVQITKNSIVSCMGALCDSLINVGTALSLATQYTIFRAQRVLKRKNMMKISNVIFHIKPILSHMMRM